MLLSLIWVHFCRENNQCGNEWKWNATSKQMENLGNWFHINIPDLWPLLDSFFGNALFSLTQNMAAYNFSCLPCLHCGWVRGLESRSRVGVDFGLTDVFFMHPPGDDRLWTRTVWPKRKADARWMMWVWWVGVQGTNLKLILFHDNTRARHGHEIFLGSV